MTQPIQSDALCELPIQIDSLDQQLLSLLNQRANVAEKVGEIKRAEGSPFFRPDRVAQVIAKIEKANQGPLLNAHVAAIWREIMSACRTLEAPLRVAYLGPAGTFSEQAARRFFGSSAHGGGGEGGALDHLGLGLGGFSGGGPGPVVCT